jgi:SAM-dependent methyltransferase
MPAYELAACPVCGTTRSLELASADEVRAEVEALWEFHIRRLKPGTPPKHLTDRVAFSQRPPLRVAECAECGLVYRNPRERSHEVEEVYKVEAPDPAVLESLFENQRRWYRAQAERLTREVGRPGTGLEVGSYVGAFLAAAREAGWRFEGLDVNERANDFARAKGFTVTTGDLASYRAANPDDRFDAVAIWNCFDQLPDPRAAAAAARRLLAPGGVLAIRVPNGGFYARLRRRLDGKSAAGAAGRVGGVARATARAAARTLLAHNNLLSFPYRHGFTPESMERLLGSAGLRVTRVEGDVLVPIADRWTRAWAAAEERAVKLVLRVLARGGRLRAGAAPWFEVFARAA